VGLVRRRAVLELEIAVIRAIGALFAAALAVGVFAAVAPAASQPQRATAASAAHGTPLFKTSADCMACHNGLVTPSGEDVSIGASWRGSMMANSSRDPYWQASVRRETMDHPGSAREIQDECSVCHMPLARTQARAHGRLGEIFSHLPIGSGARPENLFAYDGVSCTICHQITDQNFGTPASFTGGYSIKPGIIFGPFAIDKGLTTVMHSASDSRPTEAPHVRQSELCATCHTLITRARGPNGAVIGELPEQVMYLEWANSAFRTEQKSCQSCHMPAVEEETPIASVLGQPRKGFARHVFVGGNAFMLRMLNRYRRELGVVALPQELDASIARTSASLASTAAAVSIDRVDLSDGRLAVDVTVRNPIGHKLPTGYPSRRAWLHLAVRDRSGHVVFASGALGDGGRIEGNANDADATTFEPHYTEIRQPDQVQIYESIMGDSTGAPTTGLLTGVRYLKDNRLLPRGFDQASADANVATVGDAAQDPDFTGGADRVRYSLPAGGEGPYRVDVELRFQSIGFRWADNLRKYDAPEPKKFLALYDSMSSSSSEVLSRASASTAASRTPGSP
jgi:cytochrome c551/c552